MSHKRYFLLFLFLMLPKAFAQDKLPLRFYAGIAQDTLDTSSIAGVPTTTSSMAYLAGITTQFDLGTMFVFRTGAIYNQRNNTYTPSSAGPGISGNILVNYSYLDVPLHIVLVGEHFSLIAGIAAGFKVSGTPTGTGSWSSTIKNLSTSSDKSLITPFQFGVGYQFKKNFEVQLIGETSTTLTSLTVSGAPTYDIKTSSYGVRIGYTNF